MAQTYTYAKKRYTSILKRSFGISIDLFLLKLIIVKAEGKYLDEKGTTEEFTKFLTDLKTNRSMEKDLMERYKKFYQCKKDNDPIQLAVDAITFKSAESLMEDWIKTHPLHSYQSKFEESFFISIDEFQSIYKEDDHDRSCEYCGISEKQVIKLFEKGEINTKRWFTRGEKMEVDRKKPYENYINENIILCCYWCNNAKTDEFTDIEFIPIGESFRLLWNKRLAKHNLELIPDPPSPK